MFLLFDFYLFKTHHEYIDVTKNSLEGKSTVDIEKEITHKILSNNVAKETKSEIQQTKHAENNHSDENSENAITIGKSATDANQDMFIVTPDYIQQSKLLN